MKQEIRGGGSHLQIFLFLQAMGTTGLRSNGQFYTATKSIKRVRSYPNHIHTLSVQHDPRYRNFHAATDSTHKCIHRDGYRDSSDAMPRCLRENLKYISCVLFLLCIRAIAINSSTLFIYFFNSFWLTISSLVSISSEWFLGPGLLQSLWTIG